MSSIELTITGDKLEITDSLHDLIEKKMSTISNHIDHIQNATIRLAVEHDSQIAEGHLLLDGILINAAAKSDDMYKSIDELVDKLHRQAIKHKEKHHSHKSSTPKSDDFVEENALI